MLRLLIEDPAATLAPAAVFVVDFKRFLVLDGGVRRAKRGVGSTGGGGAPAFFRTTAGTTQADWYKRRLGTTSRQL